MKRKHKLLAIDVAIVIANVLFLSSYDYSFSPLKFGNFLVTIFVLGLSVLAHYMAYTKISDDSTYEQMGDATGNAEGQFSTYKDELIALSKENPEFSHVIKEFMRQISSFSTKREALDDLIRLNDDKAKDFLTARNEDVRIFLVKNLKKFVKRLIAYKAKSKQNRSSSIEEEKSIREILSQNDELINLYDQLLDEVARMGDDFDLQDPGLQSVIENLQTLRSGDEEETEEEEEEIQLFVSRGGRG